ncbi:hypothetical protein FHS25_000038 [Rhizobium laguerreae]|uniref:Uncharacterized protein n=1 Tax=Rhizobium laguerreae TaxID=1076926 RepID=A0ABR6G012_9HYPH|nr:hypothetical protein [Rhizobium laguerreae]MBB3159606.1 hypothetical protein [Rhizobium laguerreae]
MMDFLLDSAQFPSLRNGIQARWAPILFAPISGSYERLVVGVAAVNNDGFHLELANSLHRLHCFYGENAVGVVTAIQIAGDYLQADLALRSQEALTHPDTAVSGIEIGELREAEGRSLKDIAESWMAALSSLYDLMDAKSAESSPPLLASVEADVSGDRLPFMVCDYVKGKRAGLQHHFSSDLVANNKRRDKRDSQEPVVDYSGSRLVANFGTLRVSALSRSFELVKLRLWDLDTVKVRERDSMIQRQYELILQRPNKFDPQVSDKQHNKLSLALQELEEQADEKSLRLRPMDSVEQIGEHVLTVEAA